MKKEVQQAVKKFKEQGGSIDLGYEVPYFDITMPDETNYFYHSEEARKILHEIPKGISDKNYLIWLAQTGQLKEV